MGYLTIRLGVLLIGSTAYLPALGAGMLTGICSKENHCNRVASALSVDLLGKVSNADLPLPLTDQSPDHQMSGLAVDRPKIPFGTLVSSRPKKNVSASEWIAEFEALLRNLPVLDDEWKHRTQINEVRNVLGRQGGLSHTERERLKKAIEDRDNEIKVSRAIKLIDEVSEGENIDRALLEIHGAMSPISRLNLSAAILAPLQAKGIERARSVMRPLLEEAPKLAATLPNNLSGLKQGHDFLKPIYEHRPWMDSYLGSWDMEGQIQSLYDRLNEMRKSPEIIKEFRDQLIEAANGPRGANDVKWITEMYVGYLPDWAWRDFYKVYSEAIQLAAFKSIEITDASHSKMSGEPSAEEIAVALHQRFIEWNARQLEKEQDCVEGKIDILSDAFGCLQTPSTITGRVGSGIKLVGLRKLGCQQSEQQPSYLCAYNQRVNFNITTLGSIDWTGALKEAEEANKDQILYVRFSKVSGNSWQADWMGTR